MKSLAIALVLVLGVSAPAAAQSETTANIAIGTAMVGQFTDLGTTLYGMGAGRFEEANPILRWAEHRPVAMGAVKGAMAVGVSVALIKARKKHPKAAFWTAVGITAVQVGVTWHNARLLKQ